MQLYHRADGFAIASGEYDHGVPSRLKTCSTIFWKSIFGRPSAIVCYSGGSFGGVRAMQLRMILGELGMPCDPVTASDPSVGHAFSQDGLPADAQFVEGNDPTLS
ncbi:MAG: NAD(P)H-dependent oxidoreductase [Candidatus Eremiobacteraeota bacterium]|nr:NAD(P)H-dependent oxidoreductase [Candidatus Eremiobacteraeota bacterium]